MRSQTKQIWNNLNALVWSGSGMSDYRQWQCCHEEVENDRDLSAILQWGFEWWTIFVRFWNGVIWTVQLSAIQMVTKFRGFTVWNLNSTIQNRLSAVCYSNGVWSLFKWYLNGRLFVSSIQMVQFLTKFQTLSGLIFRMGYVLTQKRIQKGPILWFVGLFLFDSRNIPSSKVYCQMSPVGCGTTTKRPWPKTRPWPNAKLWS